MRRSLILVLLALVLLVAGAACGGDDDDSAGDATTTEQTTTDDTTTTDEGTTTEDSEAAGRQIFVASCGSCHTLSDAGTEGSVGPVLDGTGLSEGEIENQVRNGGNGMPAFEGMLDDDEIEDVSEYVAAQN